MQSSAQQGQFSLSLCVCQDCALSLVRYLSSSSRLGRPLCYYFLLFWCSTSIRISSRAHDPSVQPSTGDVDHAQHIPTSPSATTSSSTHNHIPHLGIRLEINSYSCPFATSGSFGSAWTFRGFCDLCQLQRRESLPLLPGVLPYLLLACLSTACLACCDYSPHHFRLAAPASHTQLHRFDSLHLACTPRYVNRSWPLLIFRFEFQARLQAAVMSRRRPLASACGLPS
jgi:hypothetical protein